MFLQDGPVSVSGSDSDWLRSSALNRRRRIFNRKSFQLSVIIDEFYNISTTTVNIMVGNRPVLYYLPEYSDYLR